MRANTNITLKERSTLTLSEFKGVDFTSSLHDVASNRATDMANLIHEDGVNRKRRGWRQRYRLTGNDATDAICGMFEYKYGGRAVLLVFSGNSLYGIERGEVTELYVLHATGYDGPGKYQAQFIMQEEKCFMFGLCADDPNAGTIALVYDGEKVIPFEECEPYVPTTTFVLFDSDIQTAETLEEPNLLTTRRKNELTIKNMGISTYTTLTLDAPILPESDVTFTESFYTNDTFEFITNTYRNEEYSAAKHPRAEYVEGREGRVYLADDYKFIGELTWGGRSADGKEVENATVTFYEEGYEGYYYTVEFTANVGEDSRIGKTDLTSCRYATTFGLDNAYLFLAGGAGHEEPNCVYYSAYRNFTYFPATSYFYVGSKDVPINGFLQMTDDTLAVLKPTGNDANIFYITGDPQIEYDSSGHMTKYDMIFKAKRGGFNEGNVNGYTTASLAGDPLMLSENGVMGLTLSQNIATDARYAKERSYSINRKLRELEEADKLKNAVAIVYKNRYYLAVDGVCFVADPRHKYTREGNDMDQSFNYEWWYWENVPARCFAIADGVLWFGTEDGRVCSFDGEGFADETFFRIEDGDMTLNPVRTVTFNDEIGAHLQEGDLLDSRELAMVYASISEKDEDGYYCVSSGIENVFEEMEFCAGEMELFGDGEYTLVGVDCTVTEVDREGCRVKLVVTDEENEAPSGSFRLLRRESLVITNLNRSASCLSLRRACVTAEEEDPNREGFVPDSVEFVGEIGTATVYHREPVKVRWVTPYFDLGSAMYAKTLLRLSVTPDSGSGHFLFGYESKRQSETRKVRGIDTLDFDNFSWENFSFDNDFASSHTVRVYARNINYLRFHFLSEDDSAFAVNNLTALYKINHMNKGVR